MTRRRFVDGAINTTILLAAAFAIGRPAGPVGQWWHAKTEERALRAQVRQEWPALSGGARLDLGAASVSLVVFSDYQCPFCKKMHSVLQEVMRDHPDIGVVHRHFPLSALHPMAERAAAAALCAGSQHRMREMNRVLFETTEWEREGDWARIAGAAGVENIPEFMACVGSRSTIARVQADLQLGERIGIEATPSFVFIGGKVKRGALTSTQLLEELRSR